MNGERSDIFHFILSIIVLLGAGYMATERPSLETAAVGVIMTVLGYWFGRAGKNGNGHSSGNGGPAP